MSEKRPVGDMIDSLYLGLDYMEKEQACGMEPDNVACTKGNMGKLLKIARIAKAMENAIVKISKLGRVCDDFGTCKHLSCLDSCQAVLIALDALSLKEKE